jgi:hypothetical protein
MCNSDYEASKRKPHLSGVGPTESDARIARLTTPILWCGVAACVLVFVYFLYQYSITGQRQFNGPVSMLMIYGLPVILGLLLAAATRLRPALRTNLTLLLLSAAVALYLSEALLSYVGPRISATHATLWAVGHDPVDTPPVVKREVERIAAAAGVRFDTRSRLEVIKEFRDREITAVPGMSPAPLLRMEPNGDLRSALTLEGREFLPLGGVSRSITVLCNESGEHVDYLSDERGFHNPEGIWSSHPLEIVAIGDSFAHGYCVPSNANFVARLRDLYPRTLNLGIAGTGPLAQWAVFLEYVPPMRPAVVLWFFYEENDLKELTQEVRSPLLMKYADGGFSQGLPGLQDEIDAVLGRHYDEAIAREKERAIAREHQTEGRVVGALKTVLAPAQLTYIRDKLAQVLHVAARELQGPPMGLFGTIVKEADTLVGSWGGELYFIYLPSRDRFAFDREYRKDEVLSIVQGAGVRVIDVETAFRETGDPLALFPFRRFGHYNEAGHQLVAETVLKALESNGSLARSAQRR